MGASDKSDRATAAEPEVSALRDGIPSACVHSWHFITKSSYDDPPYWFCAKCGQRERGQI